MVGSNNLQSVYVLVDKIEIAGDVVSSDGEHSDEWAYGDVPFFGRAGFIIFFLVIGVGGGLAMFFVSQLIVRHGAKETMKILLGEEGVAKIKQVAADLKRGKLLGEQSPVQRQREQEKAEKAAKKRAARQSKTVEEPVISEFNVDAALSANPSFSASEFGGGKSSVVATEEAKDLEQEVTKTTQMYTESYYDTEPSRQSPKQSRNESFSNVIAREPAKRQTKHFSGTAPSKKSVSAPVKKRRAVKKRKVTETTPKAEEFLEPEYEVKEESPAFEEDEDFSDFSL